MDTTTLVMSLIRRNAVFRWTPHNGRLAIAADVHPAWLEEVRRDREAVCDFVSRHGRRSGLDFVLDAGCLIHRERPMNRTRHAIGTGLDNVPDIALAAAVEPQIVKGFVTRMLRTGELEEPVGAKLYEFQREKGKA